MYCPKVTIEIISRMGELYFVIVLIFRKSPLFFITTCIQYPCHQYENIVNWKIITCRPYHVFGLILLHMIVQRKVHSASSVTTWIHPFNTKKKHSAQEVLLWPRNIPKAETHLLIIHHNKDSRKATSFNSSKYKESLTWGKHLWEH